MPAPGEAPHTRPLAEHVGILRQNGSSRSQSDLELLPVDEATFVLIDLLKPQGSAVEHARCENVFPVPIAWHLLALAVEAFKRILRRRTPHVSTATTSELALAMANPRLGSMHHRDGLIAMILKELCQESHAVGPLLLWAFGHRHGIASLASQCLTGKRRLCGRPLGGSCHPCRREKASLG